MSSIDQERARKGRDFLAGRCDCSTCEAHAITYHPEAYADWCQASGLPVPDDVADRLTQPTGPVKPPWAVLGVDLGKRTDHSAVALLLPDRDGWRIPSVTRLPLTSGDGTGHYLGQARRLAAAVTKVLAAVEGEVRVMVDATGVGDAVTEMVAAELPADSRVRLISVVLTGGRGATHRGSRFSVSKTALIGPMTAALEQGQLKFGQFRDVDVVRRELLAYRVRAASVEAGADRLEAARQSDHDDCVVAVAMAVYAARTHQPIRVVSPLRTVPRPGRLTSLYSRRLGT